MPLAGVSATVDCFSVSCCIEPGGHWGTWEMHHLRFFVARVPVVEPAFVLYWKVILESKKYSELHFFFTYLKF